MADTRRAIPPNPPRWEPSRDPASIRVPGLDTSAPVPDQIEQMEQLITLKLQNVDENFSKIHQILANKILPALKRYSVATEPVREAAKFWTSFYEQAAQIQIPTYDDYSTVNEESQQQELASEATQEQAQEHTSSQSDASQSHVYDPSIAHTDESFIPGNAAVSSTPASFRQTKRTRSDAETIDDPSWVVSPNPHHVPAENDSSNLSMSNQSVVESTFNKTSLHLDDDNDDLFSTPSEHNNKLRSAKGKAKDTGQSLLRHVLLPTDTLSVGMHVSPLKYRGKPKTPNPAKYNPFLPSGIKPADWNGIVDLRDPSITTPQRDRKGKASSRQNHTTPAPASEDDESFDGLPPGMSPPVMMSPARPPRSLAELGLTQLSQTPLKEASARIMRDLVRDIQYTSGRTAQGGYLSSKAESTMSTIPTPPSLSRYHQQDTTDSIALDSSLVDSLVHKFGLNISLGERAAPTPGLRLPTRAPNRVVSEPPDQLSTPPQTQPNTEGEPITPPYPEAHLDIDSDMDSMDEFDNTAHPSAAFLMASAVQRPLDSDDSFGSSNQSIDSFNGEDAVSAPIHPFAGSVEDDGFDDSIDDDMYDGFGGGAQEETVFGIPPRQRVEAQLAVADHAVEGLRMSGEDLIQDTIGIGTQIALTGRAQESPTPAAWGRNS